MNNSLPNKKILFILIAFLTLLVTNHSLPLDEKNNVPDWAKEVVWYQIFPERFCNSDESNDPTPLDMQGA